MGILFLIALLLAWPTYGLSLVGWLVLALVRSKLNVSQKDARTKTAGILGKMIDGNYVEFVEALDIPLLHGAQMMEADAEKCGRHVINYIAHNPMELAIFMEGLRKWKTKGSLGFEPIVAAESERVYDQKAEVHLVVYRAIEALTVNNKNLTCFKSVDAAQVLADRAIIEAKMLLANRDH